MTFLPWILILLSLSCASMVCSMGKAAILASSIRIENLFEAELDQSSFASQAAAIKISRALWRASASPSMRRMESDFSQEISSAPDSWSAAAAIAKRDAWRASIRRPSSLIG